MNGSSPKSRDQVVAEITRCGRVSDAFLIVGFVLVAVGIVGEALHVSLGLGSLVWLLLGVFATLNAIVPTLNMIAAERLLASEFRRSEGDS